MILERKGHFIKSQNAKYTTGNYQSCNCLIVDFVKHESQE